jgi:predicted nucleic acid-binding protein
VRVQAQEIAEEGVATVAESDGFQAGKQAALLLVEQAIEEDNCGLELVGRDFEVDSQARRLAEKQGLVVLGCVGVLETAFRRGLIIDLTEAYRKLISSAAYINPEILKASLARLGQPPL